MSRYGRSIEAIEADIERACNLARVRPEQFDVIDAMRTIKEGRDQ